MLNIYQKQNLTLQTTVLCNLPVYIDTLNFTMSGRKQDCVWLYCDKTKVVGKEGCQATCKKRGMEIQGLIAGIKKIID